MLYRAFIRFTEGLAIVVLSALTLLICIEVGLRYFLHMPLAWTEELVLFVFIWLAMLSAAIGIACSSHFVLGVLVHAAPAIAPFARVMALLGAAAFELVLTWQGTRAVQLAVGASPLLRLPQSAAYLSIPVSGAIGLAICAFELWEALMSVRRR